MVQSKKDYAVYFWYFIDRDHRVVKRQVLGETVICHTLARMTATGVSVRVP